MELTVLGLFYTVPHPPQGKRLSVSGKVMINIACCKIPDAPESKKLQSKKSFTSAFYVSFSL